MKNGVLILSAAGFVKDGCDHSGNVWSWQCFHEAERVMANVHHFRCAQRTGSLTTTYDPTIDGTAYERLHCSNYAAVGGLVVCVRVIFPVGSTCSYTRGCWRAASNTIVYLVNPGCISGLPSKLLCPDASEYPHFLRNSSMF